MKIRQEYPGKTPEQVAELMKSNVEQLLGEYGHYVGTMKWVSEHRIEGGGKGISASINSLGNAIEIEVKLPFMLRPLKGKIEAVVRRKLAEIA
jgi:hypothetical protein